MTKDVYKEINDAEKSPSLLGDCARDVLRQEARM
jgi:hypothetical protein